MMIELAKHLEAPEFLDGIALATWNEIAPQLFHLGFFEQTDIHCLAIYCEAMADWHLVREQEEKDFDLLFKITDTILAMSDQLGLNPAARLRYNGTLIL